MPKPIPAENHVHTGEPIRIKIIIPTNIYFLSGIRSFTLDMAKNVAGFDQQWAHRFQTVVDELTNNAIEHGSREGDDIELLFEVERSKSAKVTVSDSGRGPHAAGADELLALARSVRENSGKPSLQLRGRGFLIIQNWSDKFEVVDNPAGGISVTVQKNYEPPPPPKVGFYHSEEGGDVLVLDV